MRKDLADWYRTYRICPKCGQNNAFGNYIHCAECLEKITLNNIKNRTEHPEKMKEYEEKRREKRKEQRRERKEQGLCITCGQKATKGIYCLEHWLQRQKNRAKKKDGKLSRGEHWEIKKQSNHCLYCDKPKVEGYFFCEEHLKKRREILENNRVKASETMRNMIKQHCERAKHFHRKKVLREVNENE